MRPVTAVSYSNVTLGPHRHTHSGYYGLDTVLPFLPTPGFSCSSPPSPFITLRYSAPASSCSSLPFFRPHAHISTLHYLHSALSIFSLSLIIFSSPSPSSFLHSAPSFLPFLPPSHLPQVNFHPSSPCRTPLFPPSSPSSCP